MKRPNSIDLRDLDVIEARNWGSYCSSASPEIAKALGADLEWLNGAAMMCIASVDILAFNRVVALGCEQAAPPGTLDRIVNFYRDRRVPRFFLPIHPDAAPLSLPDELIHHGFRHHNNWVKLCRETEDIPQVTTDLRVEEATRETSAWFGEILVEAFEFPQTLLPLLSGVVGRPAWHIYYAMDGDEPVATGAMFLHNDLAGLAFAGTRPDHRGRGAQSALVARRLMDAREKGCGLAVVETAEEKPDHPSASFRNVRRLGFDVAYLRPNYIYVFDEHND